MKRIVVVALLAIAATLGRAQTTQPGRDVRAHDPSSVIRVGDDYWFFCTGPGVRAYRSRDLLNWQQQPPTLAPLPVWARPFMKDDRAWAPDVIKAPDGRYLLYYSASSFGKNTSAIGLASNKALDPKGWSDEGIVVASTSSDDFNAIDPAVMLDRDGRMWMSFGSFWSGIKLIELDPRSGKRTARDSTMHSLAKAKEIEAPFIHRRGEWCYLFVNFGLCCRGVRSTYNIRVGRSKAITGPYLDNTGVDMREGGGTLVLESHGSVIGPGHASIFGDGGREWLTFHFYDATNNGRGTFGMRPLTWSDDGWPVVGAEAGQ